MLAKGNRSRRRRDWDGERRLLRFAWKIGNDVSGRSKE